MSAADIQAVVQQLKAVAGQTGVGSEAGSRLHARVGEGGFPDALHSAVHRINELQQHSAAQGRAFQAGDPGVELHQVMMDSQKASIAFEMGVQLRNRLVGAYKEIMNMQV